MTQKWDCPTAGWDLWLLSLWPDGSGFLAGLPTHHVRGRAVLWQTSHLLLAPGGHENHD